MEDRPLRKEALVTEEMDDEFLVADFHQSSMHVLNPTAAAVFDLCDGRHTPLDIAETLAAHFQLPRERVLPDIQNILADFRTKGLLA